MHGRVFDWGLEALELSKDFLPQVLDLRYDDGTGDKTEFSSVACRASVPVMHLQ